jgi:hypothetical protein
MGQLFCFLHYLLDVTEDFAHMKQESDLLVNLGIQEAMKGGVLAVL